MATAYSFFDVGIKNPRSRRFEAGFDLRLRQQSDHFRNNSLQHNYLFLEI